MSTQKFATQALHAGHNVSENGGTRAVPIYQSTAYVFSEGICIVPIMVCIT